VVVGRATTELWDVTLHLRTHNDLITRPVVLGRDAARGALLCPRELLMQNTHLQLASSQQEEETLLHIQLKQGAQLCNDMVVSCNRDMRAVH